MIVCQNPRGKEKNRKCGCLSNMGFSCEYFIYSISLLLKVCFIDLLYQFH